MPTRSPDPPRILGQCPEARPSMRHIRDLVLVPILPISLTTHRPIALPPCVDGSELARTFLNVCSIGRCSHVFGLFARSTCPLAIMPFADQVPINSPHSTMHGGKWFVLIARSTGSALRAVCPFHPSHHAGWPARSLLPASATGSL